MLNEWGSVDGDGSADAIIQQRKGERRALTITSIANLVFFIACGVWYATTTDATALVLLIVAAVWMVNRGFQLHLFQTQTMLMIAERRTQLIEQKLSMLTRDIANS